MRLLVKVKTIRFFLFYILWFYLDTILPVNDIRGMDSRSYVKNERYLRCKLASLYRVIHLYGWHYGTCYNHVSVGFNSELFVLF
jgi:hypothetical protein